MVILRTFDVFANEIISTLRIKVIIPLSSQFSVISFNFDLCRTEVLEHAKVGLAAKLALQFLGHGDAATHDDDIDVVAGTFKKDVAHVAAHDIALHAQSVGHIAYLVEYLLV